MCGGPGHCDEGIRRPGRAAQRKRDSLWVLKQEWDFKWELFSFHLGKRLIYDLYCRLFHLSTISSSLKVHFYSLSSHTSLQTILNQKKVSIFVLLHYWTLWIFPRPALSANTFLPYATVWENLLVCSRLLLFIIHYNII